MKKIIIAVAVTSLLIIILAIFIFSKKSGENSPAKNQPAATSTTESAQKPAGSSASFAVFPISQEKNYYSYDANGLYSLAVPKNFVVKEINSHRLILIMPNNANEPLAYIFAGIPVSDLRYTANLNACNQEFINNPLAAPSALDCAIQSVNYQLEDSSYQWNAGDAFQAILKFISKETPASAPVLKTTNNQSVSYKVSISGQNRILDEQGFITMAYLKNYLLSHSGKQGITSLAFVSGCEIPQGENFQSDCARILSSFKPTDSYFENIAKEVIVSYQSEYNTLLQMGESQVQNLGIQNQTIQQFNSQIEQMQTNLYNNFQNQSYKTGENWIAALGNETNVQDQTTGNVYAAQGNYKSYCLSSDGSRIIGGNDLTSGKIYGGFTCSRILEKW